MSEDASHLANQGQDEKKKLSHAKKIVRKIAPGHLSETKIDKVKEQLDSILIRPINIIADILNEKLNQENWDREINTIKFQALRQLGKDLIERKRKGENSQEFERMTNEITNLKNVLNDLTEAKRKQDEIDNSINDIIFNQCQQSLNPKVQGLAETFNQVTPEKRPEVVEEIFTTLNEDLVLLHSSTSSTLIETLESDIANLQRRNEELQDEMDNQRRHHKKELEKTRNEFESKLLVVKLQAQQGVDSSIIAKEIENMRNECLAQLASIEESQPEPSRSRNDLGDAELKRKIDSLQKMVEDGQKDGEVINECLRNLQKTLSLVDGEMPAEGSYEQQAQSIQQRLLRVQQGSIVNDEEIQRLTNDTFEKAAAIENPDEKALFLEGQFNKLAEVGVKCIKQSQRNDERIEKMQKHINSLEANEKLLKQLDKSIAGIETQLGLKSEPNDGLLIRTFKIKDELMERPSLTSSSGTENDTLSYEKILAMAQEIADPQERSNFYLDHLQKIALKQHNVNELVKKQRNHILALEQSIEDNDGGSTILDLEALCDDTDEDFSLFDIVARAVNSGKKDIDVSQVRDEANKIEDLNERCKFYQDKLQKLAEEKEEANKRQEELCEIAKKDKKKIQRLKKKTTELSHANSQNHVLVQNLKNIEKALANVDGQEVSETNDPKLLALQIQRRLLNVEAIKDSSKLDKEEINKIIEEGNGIQKPEQQVEFYKGKLQEIHELRIKDKEQSEKLYKEIIQLQDEQYSPLDKFLLSLEEKLNVPEEQRSESLDDRINNIVGNISILLQDQEEANEMIMNITERDAIIFDEEVEVSLSNELNECADMTEERKEQNAPAKRSKMSKLMRTCQDIKRKADKSLNAVYELHRSILGEEATQELQKTSDDSSIDTAISAIQNHIKELEKQNDELTNAVNSIEKSVIGETPSENEKPIQNRVSQLIEYYNNLCEGNQLSKETASEIHERVIQLEKEKATLESALNNVEKAIVGASSESLEGQTIPTQSVEDRVSNITNRYSTISSSIKSLQDSILGTESQQQVQEATSFENVVQEMKERVAQLEKEKETLEFALVEVEKVVVGESAAATTTTTPEGQTIPTQSVEDRVSNITNRYSTISSSIKSLQDSILGTETTSSESSQEQQQQQQQQENKPIEVIISEMKERVAQLEKEKETLEFALVEVEKVVVGESAAATTTTPEGQTIPTQSVEDRVSNITNRYSTISSSIKSLQDSILGTETTSSESSQEQQQQQQQQENKPIEVIISEMKAKVSELEQEKKELTEALEEVEKNILDENVLSNNKNNKKELATLICSKYSNISKEKEELSTSLSSLQNTIIEGGSGDDTSIGTNPSSDNVNQSQNKSNQIAQIVQDLRQQNEQKKTHIEELEQEKIELRNAIISLNQQLLPNVPIEDKLERSTLSEIVDSLKVRACQLEENNNSLEVALAEVEKVVVGESAAAATTTTPEGQTIPTQSVEDRVSNITNRYSTISSSIKSLQDSILGTETTSSESSQEQQQQQQQQENKPIEVIISEMKERVAQLEKEKETLEFALVEVEKVVVGESAAAATTTPEGQTISSLTVEDRVSNITNRYSTISSSIKSLQDSILGTETTSSESSQEQQQQQQQQENKPIEVIISEMKERVAQLEKEKETLEFALVEVEKVVVGESAAATTTTPEGQTISSLTVEDRVAAINNKYSTVTSSIQSLQDSILGTESQQQVQEATSFENVVQEMKERVAQLEKEKETLEFALVEVEKVVVGESAAATTTTPEGQTIPTQSVEDRVSNITNRYSTISSSIKSLQDSILGTETTSSESSQEQQQQQQQQENKPIEVIISEMKERVAQLEKEKETLESALVKIVNVVVGETAAKSQPISSQSVDERIANIATKYSTVSKEKEELSTSLSSLQNTIIEGGSGDDTSIGTNPSSDNVNQSQNKSNQIAQIVQDLRQQNEQKKTHIEELEQEKIELRNAIISLNQQLLPNVPIEDKLERSTLSEIVDSLKVRACQLEENNNSLEVALAEVEKVVVGESAAATTTTTPEGQTISSLTAEQRAAAINNKYSTVASSIQSLQDSILGTESQQQVQGATSFENVVQEMKERVSKLEKDKQSYEIAFTNVETIVIGKSQDSSIHQDRPLTIEERASAINNKYSSIETSIRSLQLNLLSKVESPLSEQSQAEVLSNEQKPIEVIISEMKERVAQLEKEKETLEFALVEVEKVVVGESAAATTTTTPEGQTIPTQSVEDRVSNITNRYSTISSSIKSLQDSILGTETTSSESSQEQQQQQQQQENKPIEVIISEMKERVAQLEKEKETLEFALVEVEKVVVGESAAATTTTPEGQTIPTQSVEDRVSNITNRYSTISSSIKSLQDSILGTESQQQVQEATSFENVVQEMKERVAQLEKEKETLEFALVEVEKVVVGESAAAATTTPEGQTIPTQSVEDRVSNITNRYSTISSSIKSLQDSILGTETTSSESSQEQQQQQQQQENKPIEVIISEMKAKVSELEQEKKELTEALEEVEKNILDENVLSNNKNNKKELATLICSKYSNISKEKEELSTSLSSLQNTIIEGGSGDDTSIGTNPSSDNVNQSQNKSNQIAQIVQDLRQQNEQKKTHIEELEQEKIELRNAIISLNQQLLPNVPIEDKLERSTLSEIVDSLKVRACQLEENNNSLEVALAEVEKVVVGESAAATTTTTPEGQTISSLTAEQRAAAINNKYSTVASSIQSLQDSILGTESQQQVQEATSFENVVQEMKERVAQLEKEKETLEFALVEVEKVVVGESAAATTTTPEGQTIPTQSVEDRVSNITNRYSTISSSIKSLQDSILGTESQQQVQEATSFENVVQEMKERVAQLEKEKETLEFALVEVEKVVVGESAAATTTTPEGQTIPTQSVEDRVSNITNRYSTISSSIKSLQDSILGTESQQQVQEATSFENVVQEMKERVAQLEKEKETLEFALVEVEKVVVGESATTTTTPEGQTISSLTVEDRVAAINNKYSTVTSSIQSLHTRILTPQTENEQNTEAHKTSIDNKPIEEIVEEMKQRVSQLEKEKEAYKIALTSVETVVIGESEASSTTEGKPNSIEERAANINSKYSTIESSIKSLQTKILGSETVLSDSQQQTSTNNKSIDVIVEQMKAHVTKLEQANETLEAALTDVEKTVLGDIPISENLSASQRASAISSKYSSVSTALQTLSDTIMDGKNTPVCTDQNTVDAFVKQMKRQITTLEKERQDFREALKEVQQTISSTSIDPNTMQSTTIAFEINTLKKSQADLNEALTNIEVALFGKEAEQKSKESVILRQSAIGERLAEIKLLQTQFEKAMKTINDYRESVKELLISSLPEPQQTSELTFNPSISAIRALIAALQADNVKLKKQKQELVDKVKPVITTNKSMTAEIQSLEAENKSLHQQLTALHASGTTVIGDSNEQTSKLIKNQKILIRKLTKAQEELKQIRADILASCPQIQEDIASTTSTSDAFRVFLAKYPLVVSYKLSPKIESLFFKIDQRFMALNMEFAHVIQSYEDFLSNNNESQENSIMQNATFRNMSDSYQGTLRMLLPPTTSISQFSPAKEVHRRIEKITNLLRSLFQLIPNATIPRKTHIYGYVLALRRILSSSSSADISTDLSTDISMTDISFSEQQAKGGRFFEYEEKIRQLTNKLYHCMPFDDLSNILGEILQVEPTVINEETIVEMFNAVKERLDEADIMKEKTTKYKQTVEMLINGLGASIPAQYGETIEFIRATGAEL